MTSQLMHILSRSEKDLIARLRHNKFIISECDIQSEHYALLNQGVTNLEYAVSTEWSLKTGKFGKIDLVVFKKWYEADFSSWSNRKSLYNNIIPDYFVEYKNDFADSLSKKQIDSLLSQVQRINDIAMQYNSRRFRGAAFLFHEGNKHQNKTLIEDELNAISWSENLDFSFIYYNSKHDLVKLWEQTDSIIVSNR